MLFSLPSLHESPLLSGHLRVIPCKGTGLIVTLQATRQRGRHPGELRDLAMAHWRTVPIKFILHPVDYRRRSSQRRKNLCQFGRLSSLSPSSVGTCLAKVHGVANTPAHRHTMPRRVKSFIQRTESAAAMGVYIRKFLCHMDVSGEWGTARLYSSRPLACQWVKVPVSSPVNHHIRSNPPMSRCRINRTRNL